MYFLKKMLAHSPVHYIAALVLASAVTAFRFVMLPDGINAGFACYDSLSVAGYVTFLFGGLLAVAYFGAFDIFGFAFSSFRSEKGRKYESYSHYHLEKQEKRSREPYYFVPYFVVGVAVFLLSFLFA